MNTGSWTIFFHKSLLNQWGGVEGVGVETPWKQSPEKGKTGIIQGKPDRSNIAQHFKLCKRLVFCLFGVFFVVGFFCLFGGGFVHEQ